MNQIQMGKVLDYPVLKRVWTLILGLSLLAGCAKETSSVSLPPVSRLDAQAHDVEPVTKTLKLPAQVKKSDTECRVDTTGLVQTTVDTQHLKKIRERAWRRERSLKLSPDWLALLPLPHQVNTSKVVSFEISVGSSGGQIKPGFECVKWRVLSRGEVSKAQTDIVQKRALMPTSRNTYAGQSSAGMLEVSVGTNGQSVTQLDFALVPSMPVSPKIEFGTQYSMLTWLRSQPVKAFEYGVYVSGRRGLKFPGLERAVLVTKMDEFRLKNRLKLAQFVSDEKDKRVYVNGARTITSRSYETGFLSVFWQSRLNSEETDNRLKTRP